MLLCSQPYILICSASSPSPLRLLICDPLIFFFFVFCFLSGCRPSALQRRLMIFSIFAWIYFRFFCLLGTFLFRSDSSLIFRSYLPFVVRLFDLLSMICYEDCETSLSIDFCCTGYCDRIMTQSVPVQCFIFCISDRALIIPIELTARILKFLPFPLFSTNIKKVCQQFSVTIA
jgi:hypothetical protein